MTLDEAILEEARKARQVLVDLESQTAHARVDYQHAIKKLHAAGGSLREIAEALELSHQRVHQIVEGPPAPLGPVWAGGRTWKRRRHGRREHFLARFDAAARQVVVDAQKEADSLKHSYLGTEHLLLALLRHGTGKLELTADAAREQVVERIGEGEEPWVPGIPRPFTPRAKRAMEAALIEASGAERERITPEDLLVAIASDAKGTGGEILRALGVTPQQLRAKPAR